jgi:hypothetical protein
MCKVNFCQTALIWLAQACDWTGRATVDAPEKCGERFLRPSPFDEIVNSVLHRATSEAMESEASLQPSRDDFLFQVCLWWG